LRANVASTTIVHDKGCRKAIRSLLTPLRLIEASHPLLFDLLDLLLDEPQPGYVAPQLRHGQRRNGSAFRCAQAAELVSGSA
jgi:hypothetical protein